VPSSIDISEIADARIGRPAIAAALVSDVNPKVFRLFAELLRLTLPLFVELVLLDMGRRKRLRRSRSPSTISSGFGRWNKPVSGSVQELRP